VGQVRSNNEDCFRLVESLNLFVLSDGMGGEAHGEIASALAVETVVKHCIEAESMRPRRLTAIRLQPECFHQATRQRGVPRKQNIFTSAEAHPSKVAWVPRLRRFGFTTTA